MSRQDDTILGLDIGTSSIGWALVRDGEKGPSKIVAAGVRIFPTGINIDPVSGKNESRNLERRQARQRRRLLDRRQMRKGVVLRALQVHSFLPKGKPDHKNTDWKRVLELDPYKLRAKALDEELSPLEFGRVILHLCQRRGFQSNRKSQPAKDEDSGKVKQETDSLKNDMDLSGARTLGEYLSKLNPHEQRLRGRYTLREWYKTEFEEIWKAQMRFGKLNLSDELKKKLIRGLFFQRPLKKNLDAIGFCEFEPQRRRASLALLHVQRFRLLQDVNHTTIFLAKEGRERPLTEDERKKLVQALEVRGKLSFAQARKLLGFKQRGDAFNMEAGGREEFTGNVTAGRIRKVLGEKWDEMSEVAHNQLVDDLMSIERQDVFISRQKRVLGLDDSVVERLSEVTLEEGHARLCTRAIKSLLPYLEEGLSYVEAAAKAYPQRVKPAQVNRLPPLEDLRNPMVQRSLAELRRVVNAIVQEYGRPEKIRIELARDLKQNSRSREKATIEMRQRERQRKNAAAEILKQAGISQPSRADIEKALLHEECGGICPYTGKGIPFADLFGEHPRYDVEHIIPFSRSLDNSFANKTLCEVHENRKVKLNKTPFEAYGQTDRWDAIVGRVRSFTGGFAKEKLRRFLLQDVQAEDSFIEQFSTSQLNDTRYASRKAAEYVAMLYPEGERRKRVQVSAGRTTAYLRNAWRLNGLLKDGDTKSRDDHRHHAVDAIVVALTSPAATHMLAQAAKTSRRPGVFDSMPLPWSGFSDAARRAVEEIVVSHRVCRRAKGCLHEDTHYGLIRTGTDTCCAVVRKRIDALSEADIKKNCIVDPAVREAVHAKLKELGLPPAKAFQDAKNLPYLSTKNGRKIPVRRVRVFRKETPTALGKGNERFVALGGNHHLEVFLVKNKKGQDAWQGRVVSRLDVMKRVRLGKTVFPRKDEQGNPLVFTLSIGEAVRLQVDGKDVIAVVRKLSHRDYNFRVHNDARMAKDLGDDSIRMNSDSALRSADCMKLCVDVLGKYHVSND